MRITILDKYILTCLVNRETTPSFNYMVEVLKETTPVVHIWDKPADYICTTELPQTAVQLPSAALCLYSPTGLVSGYYKFCSDTGTCSDERNILFNRKWYLEGILIFQKSTSSFDIVPLVAEAQYGTAIMHEVQLHFEFVDGKWTWGKAATGFVNALFHNVLMKDLPQVEQEKVDNAIKQLGSVINLYLGSYLHYIDRSGSWLDISARAAKYKTNKDGKVLKVIKSASAGYCEFKPVKEITNASTSNSNAQ